MKDFIFNTATNLWEYKVDGKVIKSLTDKEMREANYNPSLTVDYNYSPDADRHSGGDSSIENDYQSQAETGSSEDKTENGKAEGQEGDDKEGGGSSGDSPDDPFWLVMRAKWTVEHGESIAAEAISRK